MSAPERNVPCDDALGRQAHPVVRASSSTEIMARFLEPSDVKIASLGSGVDIHSVSVGFTLRALASGRANGRVKLELAHSKQVDRAAFVPLSERDIFPTVLPENVSTLGVDFLRADKPHIDLWMDASDKVDLVGASLRLGENVVATVRIHQSLKRLGIGAVVWDCALNLCRVMHSLPEFHRSSPCGGNNHYSCPHRNIRSMRVLDLGSGTGIVGLVASILGAGEVILSDIPEIVPLIEKNLQQNGAILSLLQRHGAGRVRSLSLPWGQLLLNDDGDSASSNSDRGRERGLSTTVDLVFASDCLYDSTFFDDLLDTLLRVTHQGSIVYFAYQVRHPAREHDFFSRLMNSGTFTSSSVRLYASQPLAGELATSLQYIVRCERVRP